MFFLLRLRLFLSFLLISLASTLVFTQGHAAGLGQQGVDEEILVVAQANDALTAVSPQQAREVLEQVPGAIGFVTADDFLDNFTQSLGDTLVFTPGVYADTSAQRENRISVRGSGLNATFERRGLTVLRDGVPISRASGITEFQEIDPLSIQYIEVFKGANGLRYGAASLGGAINIVTPTGVTQDAGSTLRFESGSFGTSRFSVNTSGKSDKLDYYAAITKLDSDGFRDHSEVDSIYSFGNIGIAASDNIETRFYLTALQDDFELAGSLTLEDALNNPSMAGASNAPFDQDRNLDVFRFSNRTVFMLEQVKLETGVWVATRELDHAITPFVGIIDQSETEVGVSLHMSSVNEADTSSIAWIAGFSFSQSDNEAKVFENLFGQNGALTSEDDQDAENLTVYAQLDLPLKDDLTLVAGLQYSDSLRENQHVFGLPRFPGAPVEDDSGSIDFDNVNGRIGLLWEPSEHTQHFINISQGYEPPGITDITSGGALPFTPLEAQESITFEVGTRGQQGNLAWDMAFYRSHLENEFIDVAAPGFGAGTVTNTDNAVGDTIHQGLELGLDVRFLDDDTDQRWQLVWRNILTYNDFTFDNDPIYGSNTLAGVPELIYVTELRLDYAESWYVGFNIRYIEDGAFVDYANTAQAPGYELFGLTAGWQLSPALRLFASVENILDEEFISNVSTVANLATASGQAVFTPGEGRAGYLGITYQF